MTLSVNFELTVAADDACVSGVRAGGVRGSLLWTEGQVGLAAGAAQSGQQHRTRACPVVGFSYSVVVAAANRHSVLVRRMT